MSEKTEDLKARVLEFIRENVLWAVLGLLLELGSSCFFAAPGAAALAAGLLGKRSFLVLFGGLAGAFLHGFPDAEIGIASAAIVFAAKIIPDFNNPKIRTVERTIIAGLAVFFSRIAMAESTSELFLITGAAISSAVFAASVCKLSNIAVMRGFNIAEPKDRALLAVIAALGFMPLAALDYTYINIGRILLGIILLSLTARRGIAWCAVIGIPAAAGICAYSPEVGAGAAVLALAAAVGGGFSKFGKIARAVLYVFICSFAVMISGLDEGSWRIITESVISGAAFVFLPLKQFGGQGMSDPGDEFSDSTVAMIIGERLNFAADAIGGIGSGICAAAETLDRKYCAAPEDIPERAAERCCKSCPNSMLCWGKYYETFKQEFERLCGIVRAGQPLSELSMTAECAEICLNPSGAARAISEEYSRYLSVISDERRIRELRRIYIDQLSGVREILRDMGRRRPETLSASRSRNAEKRAEKVLLDSGFAYPQAFVMTDRRGRLRFEAYGSCEPRVDMEYLGTLLSKTLGRELKIPELSGGGGRYRIIACENTALSAKIGAFQIPRGKNQVCGDSYDSFTDPDGRLYIILSDGMGSGPRARVDSAMACSVLSKLLKSGISLNVALETVNTVLMIKSADESYATLDICRIDLNSGECALYKAGAATTYIKSSDRLIRAVLSSPPAGSGGKLRVPAQKFTVGAGDVILMMTDGVVADESWLSREISKDTEPGELSEKVAKAARGSRFSRDDDISVLAVAIND